jgi:hypothetical protein
MLVNGVGTLVCNSCLDMLADNAKVSAECIRLRNGKSCQRLVLGGV